MLWRKRRSNSRTEKTKQRIKDVRFQEEIIVKFSNFLFVLKIPIPIIRDSEHMAYNQGHLRKKKNVVNTEYIFRNDIKLCSIKYFNTLYIF